MIRAELYDCGTTLQLRPDQDPPGMDIGYFRELDFEYDITDADARREQIRDSILAVQPKRIYRPWPRTFPGNLWIDWSRNYNGAAGGPQINIFNRDYDFDNFAPVPSPLSEVYDETDPAVSPNTNPDEARASTMLSPDEVRESLEDPTGEDWLRTETVNESGQPQLKDPVVLLHDGHEAQGFAVTVNYSPCFLPVDMREKDWYAFVDDNGQSIDPKIGYEHAMLRNDARYRLYLVPAKWRMTVFCTAHYWYISYFESYGVPLEFVKAWFCRPAIYPERHDVIHTRHEDSINWNGVDYSYDAGVDGAFDRSRGSLALGQEILDAQWWTLSEAFVFVLNDPARIALWQYPPDPGEIVLGIGKVDMMTGEEQRIWVVQKQDVLHAYPREVIGLFFVPWNVVG